MNMDCPLCSPELAPIILESKHWRLVLNHNQNLLGKCFLVLKRHTEALLDLSSPEWMGLHEQLASATKLLQASFRPDHFNYAFLHNQDRHVHMHIIPRYKGQRDFAGIAFEDASYPGHYSVDMSAKKLSDEFLGELAENLRAKIRSGKITSRDRGCGAICYLNCMMDMLGLQTTVQTPAPPPKERGTSQLKTVKPAPHHDKR